MYYKWTSADSIVAIHVFCDKYSLAGGDNATMKEDGKYYKSLCLILLNENDMRVGGSGSSVYGLVS